MHTIAYFQKHFKDQGTLGMNSVNVSIYWNYQRSVNYMHVHFSKQTYLKTKILQIVSCYIY